MSSAAILTPRDTLEQVAGHRRSIRRYRPDAVPERDLLDLLRIASRAPSPWNVQPWRFVVVRSTDAKKQLRAAAFGQAQVETAPAVIVLYSDMADALSRVEEVQHPAWSPEQRAKTRDRILAHFANLTPDARNQWGRAITYTTLGYLLLAAEAFGLGSSPMLGFDAAKVKAQFRLPEHAEVAALVALGFPDEPGLDPYRLPVASITRFV